MNPANTYNLYKILGVSKDASKDEISKAYRNGVKCWHPDKRPDSEKEIASGYFNAILSAYKILKNSELREAYDEFVAGMITLEDSEPKIPAIEGWKMIVDEPGLRVNR